MGIPMYKKSRYLDKKVVRPSYFFSGNFYTSKTAALLEKAPQVVGCTIMPGKLLKYVSVIFYAQILQRS